MGKITLNSEFIFEKIFNKGEVEAFSSLSQDDNPIHTDEAYASETIFKKNVVHGILLLGMFSKIFGTIYPGNGGIYLSQSAKFLKPAFVGDNVKSIVRLISFCNLKKRGVFRCESFNINNDLLVVGEATILFPNHFYLEEADSDIVLSSLSRYVEANTDLVPAIAS